MAEQDKDQKNLQLKVPLGALAAALLIAVGGAAYIMSSSDDSDDSGKGRSHGGLRRRVGLMTLVTLIENDATRKVVVAALKALARRS
jgi:hypothetical protein